MSYGGSRLKRSVVAGAALGLLLCTAVAAVSQAEWQVTSSDGQSSIKLGFLLQGRAEWLQDRTVGASADRWTSQNLYLRRLRLLLGGKIDRRLSFFADMDGPNSGKVAGSGTTEKEFADLFLQDFVATWSVAGDLRLDGGLILTPSSYNHLQSAASLLAMDYGPYSFLESAPLKAKTGRDTGVQARGLAFHKHLEYRLGTFQGLRANRATSPFRTVGRLAYYPVGAEPGLFYPGTSLGAKQLLSVGISGDVQGSYRSFGADLYCDQPLGSGRSLTFQADLYHYDGKAFLASMPAQTNFMIETGYTLLGNRLTPYLQVARQEYDRRGQDETSWQTGLSWWVDGHRSSLKLAWGLVDKDDAPKRDQFLLQYQAFNF
jgi:hypothetical protein